MDGSKSSIISIHALLAESDRSRQIIIIIVDNFYPRSPCGERLDDLQVPASVSKISIHALLAESDAIAANPIFPVRDFYPRSPCGERPPRCRRHLKAPKFLSTLSLRRATIPHRGRNPGPRFLSTLSLRRATRISKNLMTCLIFLSTLSLRRATMLSAIRTNCIMYFYPRSPCGERRYWPCVHVVGRSISIHALLAESDTDEVLTNDEQTISIHALLAESDPISLRII